VKKKIDRNMSLTGLRIVARRNGVPFGGLDKIELYKKLLQYV